MFRSYPLTNFEIRKKKKKRSFVPLNILPSHLICESFRVSLCSVFFGGVEGNRGAIFIRKTSFFYSLFKWE